MSKTKRRNPAWTRDEHILALDYYLKNRRSYFSPSSGGVMQLAKEVSAVAKAIGLTGSDTFRNSAGVSMKLLNYRAIDPDFTTKGLRQGSKLEPVLWSEFANDPARLSKVAQSIRDSIQSGNELPSIIDDDAYEAAEGRILTRLHTYRERDRAIVRRKKEGHVKQHGSLHCEACNFNFFAHYGARGENFIECHHTKPVSDLTQGEKTKLTDLVLLCANCHRMVHAARPWWTMSDLRHALSAK